jgi:hypothetical protein
MASSMAATCCFTLFCYQGANLDCDAQIKLTTDAAPIACTSSMTTQTVATSEAVIDIDINILLKECIAPEIDVQPAIGWQQAH